MIKVKPGDLVVYNVGQTYSMSVVEKVLSGGRVKVYNAIYKRNDGVHDEWSSMLPHSTPPLYENLKHAIRHANTEDFEAFYSVIGENCMKPRPEYIV